MAAIVIPVAIYVVFVLGWLALTACACNKVSEFDLMIRQDDQNGWAG